MIPSDVQHNSMSSSAIVLAGNIVADDNNIQSACEPKSGTERLSKEFLKIAKVLPTTDSDAYYGIRVLKKY